MEGKSGGAMGNFTNVGKKHKPVSWETGGSEIVSFVLLCTRECVKHESCWRSLYTEHRASRPHYLLFTLGPLNSSAKDLLREGAAAAEYSWAPTVGTLSVHFLIKLGMSGTSSGEQKKNVDVGMHFQEVISLRIKEIEFGGGEGGGCQICIHYVLL